MAQNDRVVAEEVRRVSPIVVSRRGDFFGTIASGFIAALVTVLAVFLLDRFVFQAALCKGAAENCQNSLGYATIVGMIIGAIAGLIALTRARVYRPLLVVIAATASLWAYTKLVADMQWYWMILITTALFILAYLLFMWLARIRSFFVALIVMLILVIVVRLVAM